MGPLLYTKIEFDPFLDSFIPAWMALFYLGLLIYFLMIGGNKPLNIDRSA